MKPLKLLLALALLAAGLRSAPAQIVWHVSIKVFTDSSGNRPVDRADANIQDDYVYYNKLLQGYTRGCQFQVTEIVQMPANLSGWFNLDPRSSVNRDNLQNNAGSNAVLYAYRNNAINLYINNGSSGICCGSGNGLIFIGKEDDHINPMHEIGHMLGLAHTQGKRCNNCSGDPLGSCSTPGNDDIDDTIPDLPCWNIDQVAKNSFGNTYSNLNAGQRYAVDNVWLNIMSYHYGRFNNGLERLTPNQMDLVAETSNVQRGNTVTGLFYFVDPANGKDQPSNVGWTMFLAKRTINGALEGSHDNSVLLISAGTFSPPVDGHWRLNQPRVLCSRGGNVTLVRP